MSDKEKDLNQEDENLNQEGQDSDDSFGLPDLEVQPLDQEEESSDGDEMSDDSDLEESESFETSTELPDDEVGVKPSYMEDDDSKAPLIIGLIVTVVIIIGGLGYFLGWYDGLMGEPEPVVVEKPQSEPEPILEEPEPEPEPVVEEVEPEPEIIPGEVRTITERTSRYYIIVSSSIDGDLAMDMGKKLAAAGNNPVIIPPYGGKIYYRLGIEDHATFQEAQSRADELKAELGDGLWVLKY